MESEELEISVHQVAVKYVFRNTSDRDADVTVAFPLPEINGGDVANIPINIPTRDPVNFVERPGRFCRPSPAPGCMSSIAFGPNGLAKQAHTASTNSGFGMAGSFGTAFIPRSLK